MAELRQTFRPEFLNRIDDIIVFRALTEQDIEEVTRRMLKTVAGRMEAMDIHLDASDEAVKELAKKRALTPDTVRVPCAAPSRARWRTPWPWRTTSWLSPSDHPVEVPDTYLKKIPGWLCAIRGYCCQKSIA